MLARLLSLLAFTSFLMQAQSAVTQPSGGTISGTVTNSISGEPVRKADVSLQSLMQEQLITRPGNLGAHANEVVTTNASGGFQFTGVPPGKYMVVAQRSGFVNMGARRPMNTLITITAGQEVTGIAVKITPHAVIAGRILDEDGDPMAFCSVQAMGMRSLRGKRQLVPMGGGPTNDLGEYRISGLVPGKYYVSAIQQNQNRRSTDEAYAG